MTKTCIPLIKKRFSLTNQYFVENELLSKKDSVIVTSEEALSHQMNIPRVDWELRESSSGKDSFRRCSQNSICMNSISKEIINSNNNIECSESDDVLFFGSNRICPELWLRIFEFCPQRTIQSMLRINKWFYKLIDSNDFILKVRQTNNEVVIVLKVESKKDQEKLCFLETTPFEYFINGVRFTIYFRVSYNILLHMDFCVKFRGNMDNRYNEIKQDIDKESMRIMRFPIEFQNYLRKKGNMLRSFRPSRIEFTDTEKDLGKLWIHFLSTKVLQHSEFISNQKKLHASKSDSIRLKGLRWYLAHIGFESLSRLDKTNVVKEMCRIILSQQNTNIKSSESIDIIRTPENIYLQYTKISKFPILNSIIGFPKKKEKKIYIPEIYWDPNKGEFWFDEMYRYIFTSFLNNK